MNGNPGLFIEGAIVGFGLSVLAPQIVLIAFQGRFIRESKR